MERWRQGRNQRFCRLNPDFLLVKEACCFKLKRGSVTKSRANTCRCHVTQFGFAKVFMSTVTYSMVAVNYTFENLSHLPFR